MDRERPTEPSGNKEADEKRERGASIAREGRAGRRGDRWGEREAGGNCGDGKEGGKVGEGPAGCTPQSLLSTR